MRPSSPARRQGSSRRLGSPTSGRSLQSNRPGEHSAGRAAAYSPTRHLQEQLGRAGQEQSREVTVSDMNICVTKRFSAPTHGLPPPAQGFPGQQGHAPAGYGQGGEEAGGAPTTSKRSGRGEQHWGGREGGRHGAPPPPMISQERPGHLLADTFRGEEQGRAVQEVEQTAGGQAPLLAQHKLGKTLLNHFCEQAALSGQSLVKVIAAA